MATTLVRDFVTKAAQPIDEPPHDGREQHGARAMEQARVALGLTATAGFVDAVGYLVLYHLFIAHMSGNSVASAARIGSGEWGEALFRFAPIPLYVLGALLGAAIIDQAGRHAARASSALTLSLEAALLATFAVWAHGIMQGDAIAADPKWRFYTLVACVTIAMGLQAATLRRAGGQHLNTTVVTGTLISFSEQVVRYTSSRRDRSTADARDARDRALLLGGAWLTYVSGAVLGGFLKQRWGPLALGIPIIGLLAIVAVDLISPLHSPSRQRAEE